MSELIMNYFINMDTFRLYYAVYTYAYDTELVLVVQSYCIVYSLDDW